MEGDLTLVVKVQYSVQRMCYGVVRLKSTYLLISVTPTYSIKIFKKKTKTNQ